MEENILFKLFHNQFDFCEYTPTDTPKRREMQRQIEKEESYFEKGMSKEDWSRFLELKNMHNAMDCYDDYDAFCIGFRLGMQLLIEGALRPVE